MPGPEVPSRRLRSRDTHPRIMTGGDLAPELLFDEKLHRYTLDGERLPGITGIFGDLGMVDTSFFTEAMREFGVLRHYVTELDDVGDLDETSVDPRLIPTLHGWRAWRAETQFVPTHVEIRVYSMFGYATIIDRVGYFERAPDEVVVLNLKGPAALPTYALQLWAEARAFEERSGLEVAKRLSVHIGRTGVVKIKEHTDHTDLSLFLSALAVWQWKRAHIKKREDGSE